MTTFDTRNGHVTIDTATHKAVPKDAIVLDLSNWLPEFVAQIPAWLREKSHDAPSGSAVSYIAEEIEAQTKPARIPEPGLWGVVEASVESHGKERGRFVRDGADGYWECLDWSGTYGWSVLVDPVLIREGVDS